VGWLGLAGLGLCGLALFLLYSSTRTNSNSVIQRWLSQPQSRLALNTPRLQCPGAPFILPSAGLVGLLWRDPALPYNILRRHTGIDIFGDGEAGEVPVYAVYDGYLTRQAHWLSTVAIAHADPLVPGRRIWSYYTHMASADGRQSFVAEAFPPDTHGVWVEQGTLLGYQGEYSGTTFPIGLHVHMSLVLSEADGSIRNESVLSNTLDPSPYFGLPLNIDSLPTRPIRCEAQTR
jgi:hypothetical protein